MSTSGKGSKGSRRWAWELGVGRGAVVWGGCWDWLKPASLYIYHFVPEEVFVQHSSLTAQKHCGQKSYQRTYRHVSFVVLVSQGKATSHFICPSIKLHTFLSVLLSFKSLFFFFSSLPSNFIQESRVLSYSRNNLPPVQDKLYKGCTYRKKMDKNSFKAQS